MSKRNICEVHNLILKECDSLLKDINKCRVTDEPEDLYDVLDNMRYEIETYIVSYTEEAKEYGQSMENRMSDYRNAIEGLGFVRDK